MNQECYVWVSKLSFFFSNCIEMIGIRKLAHFLTRHPLIKLFVGKKFSVRCAVEQLKPDLRFLPLIHSSLRATTDIYFV